LKFCRDIRVKVNLTKEELRVRILFCRRMLIPERVREKSECIKNRFFSLAMLDECANVFVYISDNKGEVETKSVIHTLFQKGKKVWIPRVAGNELIWHLVNEDRIQQLKNNSWGIEEPLPEWQPSTNKAFEKTICIVPGIVFDRRGYRIGHGKGFFDRFLSKNRQCISVGFCYRFQMVVLCPRKSWDIPVDWIITEDNVFHPLSSL